MSRIVFVDTETGGLYPEVNALLTIGAVLYPFTGDPEEQFHVEVNDTLGLVEDGALKVNKINIVEHRKTALPVVEAMAQFYGWLGKHGLTNVPWANRPVMGGQNVRFDWDFLERGCHIAGCTPLGKVFSHRKLDTISLALFFQLVGKIPPGNVGGDRLWEVLGVTPEVPHHALYDAIAACQAVDVMKGMVGGIPASAALPGAA